MLLPLSLALVAGACGDDGSTDGTTDDGGGELGPAYVMMHTVSSPEGRQNYVFVTDTLDIGPLDSRQGLEVGGPSRTFALGGSVFVADAETLSVRKFEVSADTQLVPAGEVSFANFGITYFDTGFTFIDDEHAWYMASDVLKVIQFNPSTMEITGSIDVASLGHPTLTTYVDGGQKVGDYVFAAVWYYSDDDPSAYGTPEVKVAVISTTENRLVKTLTSSECAFGAVAPALPNGDLIVYGDGSTGLLELFGNPRAPKNCLLRIKAGETEFDPTFTKRFDDLTAPRVAGSRFLYSSVLDRAVAWARDPGTFASVDEYYTNTRWVPYFIDPETWTAAPLDTAGLEAIGFPGDTSVVDGIPHFTVARSDGQPGGALAAYDNGALKEQVLYDEWLQVVQRVR